MPQIFESMDKRREFFNRLITEGFHVRMHSYDYFIRKRRFVCTVLLNPVWGSATLYRVNWNLKESEEAIQKITRILKEMDPSLKIRIAT